MFASGSRGATYASFVGVALVLVTIRRPPKSRFAYLAGAALLYAGSVTLFDLRSVAVEFAGAPEATVAPTPLPEPVPEEEAPGEPRPIERSVPGSVADRSDGSRPVAPRPERPPGEERPTREFTLRDAIERFGVAPVVHMGGDAYQLGLSRPEGYYTPTPVGLFGAHQGRFVVWRGALDDIVKRPFWGYGFGLEESVFVDRYYDFQGSRPESSVLGLAIQVGTVGLAAFVAFALAILGVLVGALRRGPPEQRELVAVCGGVLLAGLLLGLVQSYVYSVGNIATLTLWVAGFLLTAAAVPRGERRRPIARSRLAAYAVALAAFVAVAVATGRWETDAYEQGELAKLAEVRAAVGPRLEGPTLSDYWHDESGFACLRYRDGQDPYAIMLCFDPETGELARAVDERGGRPLHYRVPQGASGSSPLHVSPTYLRRLISRIARAQELLYDT
jgi:uncharacterized membrane protein